MGNQHGPACFQIHGELYHHQGPLEVHDSRTPQYVQLFFYDPAYVIDVHSTHNSQLDWRILAELTEMLHEVNPFIPLYQTTNE